MKTKRDRAELLADKLDIPADALGSVKLAVRGDALRLEAMSGSDMFICGRIIALEFE